MATLTQTSIITRRIIRYGIYGVIGFTIIRFLFLTGVNIYHYFFPVPPPPPTVAFGKMPKLPFPTKDIPEGLSYTLQTPEGSLPKFDYQAKVYFMPKLTTELLSLDTAKNTAVALGFSPDGTQTTETVYSFPHLKAPAELKVSIATGIFSISYDLTRDPSPLDQRPVAPEVAASKVRSYLGSADLMPEDLTGPVRPEYVKLESGKIVGTISLSDANFVKVNFFRKDYDKLPSLTSAPNSGNVWFIVSGESQKEKLVMAAEYHYFPVDESKWATYPIKTADVAWSELAAGKAYIASLGAASANTNITIRRVYLAYYDAGVATSFYQPIIVFEGDNGFVAYLPAITDAYYGN